MLGSAGSGGQVVSGGRFGSLASGEGTGVPCVRMLGRQPNRLLGSTTWRTIGAGVMCDASRGARGTEHARSAYLCSRQVRIEGSMPCRNEFRRALPAICWDVAPGAGLVPQGSEQSNERAPARALAPRPVTAAARIVENFRSIQARIGPLMRPVMRPS